MEGGVELMGWVGVMANQVPCFKGEKQKSLFLASKQNKNWVHQECVCYTLAEVCFDKVLFERLLLTFYTRLWKENNFCIVTKKMSSSRQKDKDKLIINYTECQVKWIIPRRRNSLAEFCFSISFKFNSLFWVWNL